MAVNCRPEDNEIQPLVSAATTTFSLPRPPSRRALSSWFKRQCVIPKSKGALLLLLWNIIVGSIYGGMLDGIVALCVVYRGELSTAICLMLAGFGLMGLFQCLSYPVGGLLADLYYGRYKIVSLSVLKLCAGLVTLSIACMIFIANGFEEHDQRMIIIALSLISVVLFAAGLTGFQANAVQFGLDQLLEAPSNDLSVFLHWFVWTQYFGELCSRLFGASFPCNDISFRKILPFMPMCVLLLTGLAILFTCCKRKWFHCEPRTHSPYGMVYRVLKFAAQHSQPLRRSAFAYCDDEIPSRLDFAKQLYGGPFPTETVENVKTFFRILTMLVLIAPVFNIHIATSYLFPLYGIHIGSNPINTTYGCSAVWMVLQSGNLSYIITVVILPLYIMLVHPHIPRWLPRILHRLFLGVVLIVSVVLLMFGILVAGKHAAIEKNANTTCLFLGEIRSGKHILNDTSSSRLNFYPLTLIVPSFLNGIAVPLIHVAILEFISAQSPHTMKGVLLGAFYAFRGLAIMVGCVLVIPFTQQHWWKHTNGSLYGCGFSYYLVTLLLGLAGIGFVAIGVKWYHYRDRQDRPYDSRYVEEYYNRYTSHSNKTASSPDEQDAPLHPQIDTSILVYGTMDGT